MDLRASILAVLMASGQGVGLQDLLSQLSIKTSKRNLQRQLAALIADHQIYRIGKGPATLYQVAYRHRPEGGLPQSAASQKVMAYVTRPLTSRPPVLYQRTLLDDYIPNQTEYLDAPTRALLHHLGKTSEDTQPVGTYGHTILNRLLIDLSWASSQLEGNTYTRLDTQRLIEYGESVEGKEAIETQMILNHKDAIRFMVDNITDIGMNRNTFLNLHGLLSYNLLSNPADSGRLRTTTLVEISGTALKPLAIPQTLEECFDIILNKAGQILDPFEQAFFLMVHLPYLQPFIDVNKRVARLGANIPLLKNNLCPLTFIGMPEQSYVLGMLGVYECNDIVLLREVFVMAYEASAQEYLATKQWLVAPDPIKITNRKHIQDLIHSVVQSCDMNLEKTIADYASAHVALAEQALFKKFVAEELAQLHEGVLARYRLSKADFDKFKRARLKK